MVTFTDLQASGSTIHYEVDVFREKVPRGAEIVLTQTLACEAQSVQCDRWNSSQYTQERFARANEAASAFDERTDVRLVHVEKTGWIWVSVCHREVYRYIDSECKEQIGGSPILHMIPHCGT